MLAPLLSGPMRHVAIAYLAIADRRRPYPDFGGMTAHDGYGIPLVASVVKH